MARAANAPKGQVKYLQITAKAERVAAAGALWSGVSALPLEQFSEQQLVELRTHAQLSLAEIDYPAEDNSQAEA